MTTTTPNIAAADVVITSPLGLKPSDPYGWVETYRSYPQLSSFSIYDWH